MAAKLSRTQLAVAGIATLLVLPHLSPSLWFGEPDLPARSARQARPPRPAAASVPLQPPLASPDIALRLGDSGPLYTGSIPAAPSVPTARVVVKAEQNVAISAELNARITRMPFKEGDRFEEGAVLVEFDCQRIRAELAATQAAHKLHRNAFETMSHLQKLGSSGVYNVRQAQFEMERSAAEVDNLKSKQATCTIRAPFPGAVVERLAAAHEVVSPNQPVLKIVDRAEPELQLIVPSSWREWLTVGTAFEVDIDENRRSYQARVQNISGAVDPVSQTLRVLARLQDNAGEVMPGMSGMARFAARRSGK